MGRWIFKGICKHWYRLLARFGDPIWMLGPAEGPRKLDHAALNAYLETDLGAPSEDRCEFPYPNFGAYLTKRGLEHLNDMVKWTQDTRSKLWVNVLKVRLMMHYPQKCRQIVHNEAHVRLASGTWHVTSALRGLAFAGFAAVVAAVVFSDISTKSGWYIDRQIVLRALGDHFWTFLSPAAVFIVVGYLRRKINGFYHYQRMREVDFVLETAFTAFQGQDDLLGKPFYKPASATAANTVRCL